MKTFILKTLFFSLPVLILAGIMEVLLRNIPNDYSYKKEYLDNHAQEIETLILGSSHSFYGLNPAYFTEKTFNASHLDQYLNFDYAILKKYENSLKNLKNLVIPISYFTMTGRLEASPEAWRIKDYVIYYDLNTVHSIRDYSEVLYHDMVRNLERIVSYYLHGKPSITCSKLGWGVVYHSSQSKNLEHTGKHAARLHTVAHFKYLPKNQKNLTQILEFCKNRDINVVLFTPPASEPYIKYLNRKQLNITIQSAKKISDCYDKCIYINLLSSNQFCSGDFYDGDHLNEIGARKLSLLINDIFQVRFYNKHGLR